jgi:anti-sigma factor RsiW
MECERARPLMQAYLDDELDAVAAAQVTSHLLTCTACDAAFEELLALRALVGQHGRCHRAPAQLRQRLHASFQDAKPRRRALSSWPWSWINLGLAATTSAALAVTLGLFLAQPSNADRRNAEIVASHFRSVMSGHMADVASSDQHTVKPWFAGKIDYSPPVYDLGPQGFQLVGGRLDYVAARPVAVLAYRHRKHVLDLYLWPATGAREPGLRAASQRGFQLLSWTQRDMQYVAISDMSAQDLEKFAGALEAQVAQSGSSERREPSGPR